jgi:hypothetical protein
MAIKEDYCTIGLEAHEDKTLTALRVPLLRKLLFGLDRVAGAGDAANREPAFAPFAACLPSILWLRRALYRARGR